MAFWDDDPIVGGDVGLLDQPQSRPSRSRNFWESDPTLEEIKPPKPSVGERLNFYVEEARREDRSGDPGYVLERIPFVGGAYRAVDNLQVLSSANKIEIGEADDSDFLRVGRFLADQEHNSQLPFWRKVVDVATRIPRFAVEFMGTGGAFTAGREGTEQLATRAIGKFAESAVGRAATRTAGFAAGAATQAVANPQLIAANATERMIPQYGLTQDEAGKLQLLIAEEGDGFAEALAKGYGDAIIEMGAERAGAALPWVFGKLPGSSQLRALKEATIGRWLNANPGKGVSALFDRVASEAGWHGVLGEIFEERVGEVARGVTGVADDFGVTGGLFSGNPQRRRAAREQLLVEGTAFAIPGATRLAAETALRERRQPSQTGPVDSTWQEVREQYREDPQGFAQQWARENPEKAQRLAALEKPSRPEWDALGPRVRLPAEERQDFTDRLRRLQRESRPGETAPEGLRPSARRIPPADTERQPQPSDALELGEFQAPESTAPASKGRVFRETSVAEAETFLPNSTTGTGYTFGPPDLFVADSPDLAIGQGGHTGVLLEFDSEGIDLREHRKPGTQMPGAGKEFVVRRRPEELRQNLVAVTLKTGAKSAKGEHVLIRRRLKQLGWEKATNPDGSVTYRKPEAAAPQHVPPARRPGQVRFKTAKGSEYVMAQGRTQRTKALRAEHGDDQGLKEWTDQTVFLAKEHGQEVAMFPNATFPIKGTTNQDYRKSIEVVDDAVNLVLTDPRDGSRKIYKSFPFQAEPSIGLMPVEQWGGGYRSKSGRGSTHVGNPIVEVETVQPQANTPEQRAPLDPLQQRIAREALRLGGGKENVRVRLADLRKALPDVPRAELDAALEEMQQGDALSLYKLDNPQEIRPEDEAAAIKTATGAERHILYFGGRSSGGGFTAPQPIHYRSNDGTNRSYGTEYGPAVRAVMNTDFVNYSEGMKRLARGLPPKKQSQEKLRDQLWQEYQQFTTHTLGRPRSLEHDLTARDAILDPAMRRKLTRLGFTVGEGSWQLKDATPTTAQQARTATRPAEESEPGFQPSPPKPRVAGRETTIRAEGHAQPIPATFAVMELADVIPSHDYSGGASVSNVKKGRYPSSLQPRDYSPASVEDEKVFRRAAQFDPRYLLSDAADALDGSPVVEPSGIVINGNSRAMMLQLLASRSDPALERYREALIERAEQFGIGRDAIESMQRPVLVRVVDMDPRSADARRFAQAGNITTTGEQSTAETAKKFRTVIDADLIGRIRLEADTTFSEAINSSSAAAREFRSALRKSLPQSQVARYFEGDELSVAGRDLVRSILLQEVVPEDVLDRLEPGELRMLDAAIPQLLKAKRDSAPGEDLTPLLVEALRFLAEHDPRDVPDIDRVLRQGQMFREKPTISPQARTVLEFLIANSRRSTALREALKRLLADASKGPALFEVERLPFADRLAEAFSIRRETATPSGAAYAPMAGETGATEFETGAVGGGDRGDDSLRSAVDRLFPAGIRPLPLPELVELAQELMGQLPVVTKRLRSALGLFKSMGHGHILLRPDIFKDPVLAAKVLAHELGHLIDYLPDLTLKRGNILGRIASLRGHLQQFIAGRPGGMGPLTEADIERLSKIAEELATTTKEIEVDEEIRRVVPITPQDIIDVWNTIDTSKVNQDLLAYIKTLDRREKASIIKEAMKGLVPEELQRFAQVFLEKTGRKVKKVVDKDGTKKAIREKFNELVLEEARKRQLLENNPIRLELIELTKWWSGDFSKAPPRYQRYRRSSRELYAEALSVFLNAPAELEKRAPEFFRGFTEYLERKPEVVQEFLALQDLLAGTPEELAEHRQERLFAGFGKGTEKIKAAAAAREEARMDVREAVVQLVSQGILDRSSPVKAMQRLAEKKGKKFAPDQSPAYILDELFSIDNPNYLLMDRTQRTMYKPLLDAGITADDIGQYLFLRRIVNERNQIANPLGFDPKAAQQQIDHMKQTLGVRRWKRLDETMQKWHNDVLWPIIEEAVEAGVYSREVFESKIKPNKGNYATFAVVEYLEDYVPAGLKQQVGTFKEIANPLHATLMKMITLQRLIQMNRAKAAIRNLLRESFPGEIEKLELKRNTREPIRGAKAGRDFMLMLEDGKLVAYEVEQSIARSYQSHDIGMLQQYGSILASWVYRIFHPLFVTFNPGFIAANPFRDIRRTHKLLGSLGTKLHRQLRQELEAQGMTPEQAMEAARPQNITLGQVLKAWWKALPEAANYARGKHAPQVERMLEDKALAIPYTSIAAETGELIPTNIPTMEDKSLAERLAENRNAGVRLVGRIMHGIEMVGTIQETATKLAGYNLLGARGVSGKERAFLVRKYVGTPDYKQKGLLTNITNSMLLYSKVRWNGLQAEARMATDPQTAAGYWWRTFVWAIAPTTLTKLASYGMLAYLLGGDDDEAEADKQWWAEVAKYFTDHYDVIPLGTTEVDGQRKPVFVTIPRDEVSTLVSRIYGSLLDGALEQFGTETKTGSLKQALRDSVGATAGELLPSRNPALEMVEKWFQYGVLDVNPTDSFTSEPIVPRTHWEAGGWAANKKMLAWTLDKFGVLSTIVHPVTGPVLGEAYTSGDETTLETTIRSTPGLNRLVRVSDRGKDEQLWLEIENKKAEAAQFRLGLPKAARDLTLEQYKLAQATSLDREEQMRKVVVGTWYSVDYLPLTRAMKDADEAGDEDAFESLKRELAASSARIERGVGNVPEEYVQRILWRLGDPTVNPSEDGSPAVSWKTSEEWVENRRSLPETELLRRSGVSAEKVIELLHREQLRQQQLDEDREAARAGREPREFVAARTTPAYWARLRRLRELFR